MTSDKRLYVTQPHLPPLEEFVPYLRQIWDRKILTNSGPFHAQLERALCDYLGVEHIALFANGTLALVTALQALRISGEVITTPYSFVATAHSLLWNGIKPVFVDVDPTTLNLDPKRVEAAIAPHVTAILPVHCYGHPCDVAAIQAIADRYNLKVIYDAAHAFGVRDAGGSILRHGDLSVLSFHATKVFTTFEGGAIVCPDAKTKQRIDAAYRRALSGVPGIRCLGLAGEQAANYIHFPILVGPEYPISRDALYQKLRDRDVFARRYFYPLISEFPMYRGLASASSDNLPVATERARQVLCLPIFPAMEPQDVERVIEVVTNPLAA